MSAVLIQRELEAENSRLQQDLKRSEEMIQQLKVRSLSLFAFK